MEPTPVVDKKRNSSRNRNRNREDNRGRDNAFWSSKKDKENKNKGNKDANTSSSSSEPSRMEEKPLPPHAWMLTEHFNCSICFELLVNPTTLSCGHTSCRHCLLQWRNTQRRNTCPECQQSCREFPQINFRLRDTIDSLFPEEAQRRWAVASELEFFDEGRETVVPGTRGHEGGGGGWGWGRKFLFGVGFVLGVRYFFRRFSDGVVGGSSSSSNMVAESLSERALENISPFS